MAYRAELKELYELGCRKPYVSVLKRSSHDEHYPGNIQIDDPTFCYFCDESMIIGMEKAGVDHEALLDTYIRAINIITEGRPKDLTIGVHMCRGNFKVKISQPNNLEFC